MLIQLQTRINLKNVGKWINQQMQQLLAFQELVLMPLSLYQSRLILINYVKTSCRAVFGTEIQLADAGIPLLLALVIQDR